MTFGPPLVVQPVPLPPKPETPRAGTAFSVTAESEPSAEAWFAASTPPVTVVAPVYVLVPARASVPVFALVNVPAPETTPDSVTGAVPVTSIVPPPAPRTTALAMLFAPVVRKTDATAEFELNGLMKSLPLLEPFEAFVQLPPVIVG